MEEFGYFGAVWCQSVDGRGLGASQQVTPVHCREGSIGWVGEGQIGGAGDRGTGRCREEVLPLSLVFLE